MPPTAICYGASRTFYLRAYVSSPLVSGAPVPIPSTYFCAVSGNDYFLRTFRRLDLSSSSSISVIAGLACGSVMQVPSYPQCERLDSCRKCDQIDFAVRLYRVDSGYLEAIFFPGLTLTANCLHSFCTAVPVLTKLLRTSRGLGF